MSDNRPAYPGAATLLPLARCRLASASAYKRRILGWFDSTPGHVVPEPDRQSDHDRVAKEQEKKHKEAEKERPKKEN